MPSGTERRTMPPRILRRESTTCTQPTFKELQSRLMSDSSSSLILSPPPSPPTREYSLRRKHLSTGSLGRYFTNVSTISLLRPSNTSNHANLDADISENAIIEEVQRIPITRCIAKEVIYSKGEKLYVTWPSTIDELHRPPYYH